MRRKIGTAAILLAVAVVALRADATPECQEWFERCNEMCDEVAYYLCTPSLQKCTCVIEV